MFVIEHSVIKTSRGHTVALILVPQGLCRCNVVEKILVFARDRTPITECIVCHYSNVSMLVLRS